MRKLLLVLTLAVVGAVALAGPAWGQGDPALDRLIVKNPIPGWSPLSATTLQTLVTTEERTESAAANERVTSAAEGWQGESGEGAPRLIVAIDGFPQNIPDAARIARGGAISGCTGATDNAPTSVEDYGPIPGSVVATCSGTNQAGVAIAATAIVWIRGNLLVFLVGVGLPTSQVESIATGQDSAIAPTGAAVSSSDTGTVVGIVVGVVVVLGLVIGLVIRAQRRRNRTAMTAPRWSGAEGGARWVADPSGRHELRYWSGIQWTEHVMSNGIPATDPLPTPTFVAGAAAGTPGTQDPAPFAPTTPVPPAFAAPSPDPAPFAPATTDPGPFVAASPDPAPFASTTPVPPAFAPTAPDPAPFAPATADPAPAPSIVGIGSVSDDGHWFWNGVSWASTTSSDGLMKWNGTQWVPVTDPGAPSS